MNTNYTANQNNTTEITSASLSPELLTYMQELKILQNKSIFKQPHIIHSEGSINDLKQIEDKLPIQNKKGLNGTTDPIKDSKDIEAAKAYFLNQPLRYKNNQTNIRNYALFVFTINCARRIGDVLKLKIKDVLNEDMTFKHYIGEKQSIGIQEQKTKKTIRIPINQSAQEALLMYFNTLTEINFNDPIFKSRKSKDINKAKNEYIKALSIGDKNKIKYTKDRLDVAINFTHSLEPKAVSTILKKMSKEIGLDKKGININTHSMRKTKAYHIYQQTHNLETVSKLLNHSKSNVTKRYIGIDQEEIDDVVCSINL